MKQLLTKSLKGAEKAAAFTAIADLVEITEVGGPVLVYIRLRQYEAQVCRHCLI